MEKTSLNIRVNVWAPGSDETAADSRSRARTSRLAHADPMDFFY
jgi:hypothetical protein